MRRCRIWLTRYEWIALDLYSDSLFLASSTSRTLSFSSLLCSSSSSTGAYSSIFATMSNWSLTEGGSALFRLREMELCSSRGRARALNA